MYIGRLLKMVAFEVFTVPLSLHFPLSLILLLANTELRITQNLILLNIELNHQNMFPLYKSIMGVALLKIYVILCILCTVFTGTTVQHYKRTCSSHVNFIAL